MSKQRTRGRFALGVAAGLTLAYTAVRSYEAYNDLQTPGAARERDPHVYGNARRWLMVVNLARSVASAGVIAFGIADAAERALKPLPPALRLPLFASALTLLESIRETPVDYVEEYVLERIYGNSERTAAAWAADRAKSVGLGVAVSGVLSLMGGALMLRAPKRWPWIAIVTTPALLAFANVIVPTFVMPLFNKYVPLEGALERKIRDLAARPTASAARKSCAST